MRKKNNINEEFDDIYDVDIHIFRHKGMDSSIQVMSGNALSLMTAMASGISSLVLEGVIERSQLSEIFKMIEQGTDEALKEKASKEK
jgi:hypothetical protein